MTKEEAVKAREEHFERVVLPFVILVFQKYPQLRSAALCVADLPDDLTKLKNRAPAGEGNVRFVLVWSDNRSPDLDSALKCVDDQIADKTNLFALTETRRHDVVGDASAWNLDGRYDEAYRAFCCDPAVVVNTPYTPYALMRREGTDTTSYAINPHAPRPELEPMSAITN